MIVICANWAITDGTLGGRAADARAWLERVHRAVMRGGFRGDGRYRPVEAVDLVFAGDTFDWFSSTAWTGADRPWHAGPRVRDLRARVRSASARQARPLLAGLARWTRRGLGVPAADHIGRPRLGTAVPVPVRVTFLVGDRDAWLEDTAPDLGRFGCHVGQAWSNEHVDVRHGAEFDPLHGVPPGPRAAGDGRPTIHESLLVDLVALFGARLSHAGHEPTVVGALAATLAAVGPLEMPAVVAGMAADRVVPRLTSPETILDHWRRAVEAWHRAALAMQPFSGLECCPLDALAAALEPNARPRRPATDGLAALLARPSFPPTARFPHRTIAVLGHPPAVIDPFGSIANGPVVCLGGAGVGSSPIVAGAPDRSVAGRGLPVAAVATIAAGRTTAGGVEWQWLHGDRERPVRAHRPLPPVIDAA